MWSWFKSILLALIVTGLIWVFAEAETLRKQRIETELAVQPEVGSKLSIDVLENIAEKTGDVTTLRIKVDAEGSAGALDAVQRLLSRPLRVTPAQNGVPSRAGETDVDLREVLRNHPSLRELGISITDVQPESVRIRVDEVISVDAPVQVVTPEGQTEGAPEATPRTVTLRYPMRLASAVPTPAVVTAVIDERAWRGLIEGRREVLSAVRVVPPAGLLGQSGVRIDPPIVDVAVTVRSRTSTITINAVPVALRVPPEELARFDITIAERDRAILDVTVQGPAEFVRQIEEKTLAIVATVPLTFEDLERGVERGELLKEVSFHSLPLPPGVKIDAPNRTVRIVVTRREAPKTPGS